MTSTPMYAAPPTIAGAPTMTSMYATAPAMTSMYMPASTVVAQPTQATVVEAVAPGAATPMVAAPPMVAAAAPASYSYVPPANPSYVPPPGPSVVVQQPAAPVGIPPFSAPAPQRLTTGLDDPNKIEQEKLAYEKALDAQLKKQSDALLAEAKLKKDMMEQQAKMQLAQFQLQIEEQLKMQSMQVDAEAQTMIRGLEEAAIYQKTAMQEQAAMKVADYVKKKAIEDMSQKSYDIQKQYYEAEIKMATQYQQARQAGAKAIAVAPQGSPIKQIPVRAGISSTGV